MASICPRRGCSQRPDEHFVHNRLARAAHVQRTGEREHHDYAAQHLEDAVDGLENQLASHGSGIWANHELPARAEESVYDARKNGRIETDDRRKSCELCVGDGGGNLNRSDGEPGNQIRAKIFRARNAEQDVASTKFLDESRNSSAAVESIPRSRSDWDRRAV
jgi:hypothetical protein